MSLFSAGSIWLDSTFKAFLWREHCGVQAQWDDQRDSLDASADQQGGQSIHVPILNERMKIYQWFTKSVARVGSLHASAAGFKYF